MSAINTAKPLSREDCYEYLRSHVFSAPAKSHEKQPPGWPGGVGLEVEMIPVCAGGSPDEPPRTAPIYGKDCSLFSGISKLCEQHDWDTKYIAVYSEPEKKSDDQVLYRIFPEEAENISFEPGAQVEFASQPHRDMGQVVSRVQHMQALFDGALDQEGIALVQLGMNPWHSAEDIGLQISQGRYQAMNQYFNEIGPAGAGMMRQSCSIQINLDLGPDDDTFLKRYLAAQLIAPFAAALFANSPIVEGQLRPEASVRVDLWQRLDPARTGLIPSLLKKLGKQLTKSACIEGYLDFALSAPVIFIEDLDYHVPKSLTFGQWLESPYVYGSKQVQPQLKDFVTHLSLLFPDVRPKGFLEIRSVDGQTRALQFVPMVFYIALLYEKIAVDKVLELLLPQLSQLSNFTKKAPQGLQDNDMAEIAKRLMEIADEGLSRLPDEYRSTEADHCFRQFRSYYTEKHRTPADDIRDLWETMDPSPNASTKQFGLSFIRRIEDLQSKQMGL